MALKTGVIGMQEKFLSMSAPKCQMRTPPGDVNKGCSVPKRELSLGELTAVAQYPNENSQWVY